MKKSLLALAVLGSVAGVAQAQSSVTIYGLIDTGISYNSNVAKTAPATGTGSKFALNSGIINGSRIGFKGVEDLGGGLNAVFQLENGFTTDDGKDNGGLFQRKAVVGLSGGFGTVLAGRQTDFLDDIGALTSVSDFGGIVANAGSDRARLQGTRSNNSIRYNTNNLSGFTGSLIYGFGEKAGSASQGQAYGIGGKYENGPLALAAGYYQSKGAGADTSSTSQAVAADQTAVKTYTLAASFKPTEASRIYANWSRTKFPSALTTTVEKQNAFDLGGSYLLSNNIKLIGSVQYAKLDQKDVAQGKLTQVNLGANYLLSKRTDIYTVVSYLKAKDTVNPGIGKGNAGEVGSNQTAVNVGIRHRF